MNNTPTPRTDEFISTLIIGTIDRNNGRIAWGTKDIETLVSHARQLEQELTLARACLEISTDNTKAALNSFHAENKQRRSAEAERNQLRKVVDELATTVRDYDDVFFTKSSVMRNYSQLPHVQERKTK